jgi:ATP-binding cassette, subfamily B, bacterial
VNLRSRLVGHEFAPFIDRRGRWLIVLLSIASVVGGLLEAAALLIVTKTALASTQGESEVVLADARMSVVAAAGVGLLLLAVRLGVAVLGARVNTAIIRRANIQVVDRMVHGFLQADWRVAAGERLGDLQQLVTGHAARVGSEMLTLGQAISNSLNLLVLLVISAVLSPAAVGAVLIAGSVLLAAFRPLNRIAKRHSRDLASYSRTFSSRITEVSRLSMQVRTNGVGPILGSELSSRNREITAVLCRLRFVGLLAPTVYQCAVFALTLVLVAGLQLYGEGQVAQLAGSLLLLLRSLTFVQGFQIAYQRLLENRPFLIDLVGHLDMYEASPEQSGTTELNRVDSVAFERVGFRYDDRFALNEVSFALEAGESLGIVGPSGGGKSTLLQLVLGLREPSAGCVLINRARLSDFRKSDLRRRISFVPQDPALMAGTISENVRFFRDISDEVVARACSLAHLDQDLADWPDGYLTSVGEGGNELSGGQRQRVCIARALAGQPDVLVLDEPTSSLDAGSEEVIHQTLESLRGRTTVIVVAHRPGTIRACDTLLVVRDGRVQASGPVERLAEEDEFVKRMLTEWPGAEE